MQFIRDIYAAKRTAGKPVISFEFFPPKTEEGDRNLLEKQIPALMATQPDYCSVTYGAGGTTWEKTLMIVDRIQREHQLTALAHLTCVNHTRDEILALLEKFRALGCQNILALRGDPEQVGQFQRQGIPEHQAALALAAGGAPETELPLGQFHRHPALAHAVRPGEQHGPAEPPGTNAFQKALPHRLMTDQSRIEHYRTG